MRAACEQILKCGMSAGFSKWQAVAAVDKYQRRVVLAAVEHLLNRTLTARVSPNIATPVVVMIIDRCAVSLVR